MKLIAASILFFMTTATTAEAVTLSCEGTMVTVEPKRINVSGDNGSFAWVQRRHDRDCAKRKTSCYQQGQWMANVSRNVFRGMYIYINTDTDDIPGVGVRLKCTRIN